MEREIRRYILEGKDIQPKPGVPRGSSEELATAIGCQGRSNNTYREEFTMKHCGVFTRIINGVSFGSSRRAGRTRDVHSRLYGKCPECELKTIVRRKVKTPGNNGRIFYTCPSHQMTRSIQ
uniref:Zinc finger GRF-type domain-containing protein n=1 Tax=Oryza punctata TaxID=4537 RepID=A0A0E0MGD8_ORYPU